MIPARCMCEDLRLTWTGIASKPCFRCWPFPCCLLLSKLELLG